MASELDRFKIEPNTPNEVKVVEMDLTSDYFSEQEMKLINDSLTKEINSQFQQDQLYPFKKNVIEVDSIFS